LVVGVLPFALADTSIVSSDAQTTPESLNSLIKPIRLKYDLPALAAAIVTSKGLIASGAVGVRKYGTNSPVTVNDQFHLGSDTKAMTATMLATLVEAAKLSWTTTIEQVFPELASKMNPGYRQVTLEQLLAHRAGFTVSSVKPLPLKAWGYKRELETLGIRYPIVHNTVMALAGYKSNNNVVYSSKYHVV
jgi:CubicO group peptidase (beta-lactamase class C family)